MLRRRHCEERKRRSNPVRPHKDWIASLALAMTLSDARIPDSKPTDKPLPPRGARRPSFDWNSPPSRSEGAGNAGCATHPRPRTQRKKRTSKYTTGSPEHSGIPCATVYGLLRALSGDRALLSPSPAQCASIVASFTPASRRQDHTASPSASGTLVRRAKSVHRIPRQRS